MKAVRILMVLPLWVWASFFPPTTATTIEKVEGSLVSLARPLPVAGMSGVVIHRFRAGRSAVTGIVVQTGSAQARLQQEDLLDNDALPRPKTAASPGDRVIGGYLYSNVLLLAPDAQTYTAITRSAARHWIHPDLFAAYLARRHERVPTVENLAAFARQAQVGLIYIVRSNDAILFDPLSRKIVGRRPFHPRSRKALFPFYSRFGGEQRGDYYQSIGAIR